MTLELGEMDARAKIEAAKEHNVRFVQMQFTDIIGVVKSVTIPLHQLEGSITHGTWSVRALRSVCRNQASCPPSTSM